MTVTQKASRIVEYRIDELPKGIMRYFADEAEARRAFVEVANRNSQAGLFGIDDKGGEHLMDEQSLPKSSRAILHKPGLSGKPWQVVQYACGGCYFQGEFATREDAENHLEYLHNLTAFGDYPDGSF